VENEGNKLPVADPSRMMINMSNDLNEVCKEVLKEVLKRVLIEILMK
jgi:hypothetical protein